MLLPSSPLLHLPLILFCLGFYHLHEAFLIRVVVLPSKFSTTIKQNTQAYLNISAICRKIHLNDKTGDVFTVADPVQGCALSEVIEVNGMFLGTHS